MYFKPKKKSAIKMTAAIILPELKGSPMVFMKNNSVELKNCRVYGNKNLKTNSVNT